MGVAYSTPVVFAHPFMQYLHMQAMEVWMSEQDARVALSGFEMMRAAAEGRGPRAPIGDLMNMTAMEVPEPGRVVFHATPERRHYNPIGSVHGGYAATLLDSAMGCAVHSALPAGKAYTTLSLEIKYVKGMTDQTGPVIAEGRVIQAGSRQATAEGYLRGPDGTLYAHGVTTCLVIGR
jgi:uncharacterized protein (TIGR00369 family)